MTERTVVSANEQDPEVFFTRIKLRRRVSTGRPKECGHGLAKNACRRVAVQAATIPTEVVPRNFRSISVVCCDRKSCMADAKTVALALYASRAGWRMVEIKANPAA